MRNVLYALKVTVITLALPATALAQGSITGVARDTSGAILPGVTVETTSPALIEKARTAVTDGAGQYRIVDLPPGVYDVTFALSGFKTVRREGIVLQGTFVAQVNGDLQVGTLEETIVVTGASPTVDVINNTAEFVADRDVLDSIPTAVRNTPLRALLLPGTQVTPFVLGQYTMSVHGSASQDTVIAIDGMRVNNLCGSGQFSGFYMNDAAIEEVTFTTGAESAEMQAGGLRINSTPKDGGNTFSGTFFLWGAAGSLQSDNRSDEVKAAGVPEPGIDFTYQINPSIGGPIVRDKLWFYFTYKFEDNKIFVASSQFADGSRAFRQSQGNYSAVTRLTWQATQRDKIRFYLDRQFNGEDYNGFNTLPNTTPEASTHAFGRGWVPQIKWSQTTTDRLLLEAGITYYHQPYEQYYTDTIGPLDLPRVEQTTGQLSGAAGSTIPPYTSWTKSYSSMAAASYVTGSHAIKTGVTMGWGSNSRTFTSNAEINQLIFNSGNPAAVVVTNGPATAEQRVNSDIGVFVQDAWTMRRLTLNVGARFDHFNAEVPAQSAPAGTWIIARDFPAIKDVPNWDDWSVRTAIAYDLFGNGKTALKLNASKYIASAAAGYAQNFNGMSYAFQTRGWGDFDGNRSIFDAAGNIQFNEVIGGTSNFGQVTNRPDPDLARGYNWEYNALIQHELFPRVSVNGGYFRRQFYNLDVIDNLNLAFTDWNELTILTPNDPRLPLASEPIVVYSLNTNKNGTAVDNLRTYSDVNETTYDGLELSANARFSRALFFGGITTERRASTDCDGSTTALTTARDNPNGLRFCDSIPPFRTTVKLSGVYQLPWEFQMSGTFQSIPGASISANYDVNAAVAGRPVLGSQSNQTFVRINLVESNTMFLDRRNQLDLRASRNFRFGRYRIQAFADIFNVLNAGTVVRVNETYSNNPATNTWLRPQAIQDGRYVRFGTQMSF